MYYCYLARIVAGDVRLRGDPDITAIRWFPLSHVRNHREVSPLLGELDFLASEGA